MDIDSCIHYYKRLWSPSNQARNGGKEKIGEAKGFHIQGRHDFVTIIVTSEKLGRIYCFRSYGVTSFLFTMVFKRVSKNNKKTINGFVMSIRLSVSQNYPTDFD